jgi:hypothetical protein
MRKKENDDAIHSTKSRRVLVPGRKAEHGR